MLASELGLASKSSSKQIIGESYINDIAARQGPRSPLFETLFLRRVTTGGESVGFVALRGEMRASLYR